MVKRRSLDDALTPEEESFLAGKTTKQAVATSRPQKDAQLQTPAKRNTEKDSAPAPKPASQEIPADPNPSPPESYPLPALVGLNTRVDPRLSGALLQASMERRIKRLPMSKVQDIVGEALSEWLKKHGYLK